MYGEKMTETLKTTRHSEPPIFTDPVKDTDIKDKDTDKGAGKFSSSKWTVVLHIVFVFLIAASILVQMNHLNSIAVLNDEFGYWGIAASYAGYDWTPLLSQTPFYSAGYSWILAMILRCGTNPVVWYRIAIGLNVVLSAGCYFLAYLTIRNFGKLSKRLNCTSWLASLIAGISVLLPSNMAYGQVAWPEILLVFLTWLSTYLILKNQIAFSYGKTALILLVLIYSYAVHIRAFPMFLFGTCLCAIQIWIKQKGKQRWIGAFLAVTAALLGFLIVDFLNDIHLFFLWTNSASSSLNNVSADSAASGYLSLLVHNPGLFFFSLLGKVDYAIFATGFLIFIPLFQMVYRSFCYFQKKEAYPEFLVTFWIVCLPLGMILLTAFQMSDWQSRQDIEVYSRYFEFALGPLIALGWLEISRRKDWKVNLLALLTAFAVFCISILFVYRAVKFSEAGFTTICAPVIGGYVERYPGMKRAFVMICAHGAVIGIVWMLYFLVSRKGVRKACFLFLSLFTLVTALIDGWDASKFVLRARSSQDAASEATIAALPELTQDVNLVYIANADLDPYSVMPKYVQYYIPDHTIELFAADLNTLPVKDEKAESENKTVYLIKKTDEKSQKALEKKGYVPIKTEDAAYMKIYH